MGSRVMHYCISTILRHELKIEDDQFLLGSLAPDVYKNKSELKEISHFIKKNDCSTGYIDYGSFHSKYLTKNTNPFHLGYYFHLISDDIWLKDIYNKKIKWLTQDIKIEARKRYYRDFWRLNGKIIDFYSLELAPLKEQPIDIEEIDFLLFPELISDLETDFNMADSVKGESLEILEFTEVIQTIERTVTTCKENLKKT